MSATHDDSEWVRSLLDTATKAGDLAAARRCVKWLNDWANERQLARDRRIAARRFSGEPNTVFGEELPE
jgi:hypothetical protein